MVTDEDTIKGYQLGSSFTGCDKAYSWITTTRSATRILCDVWGLSVMLRVLRPRLYSAYRDSRAACLKSLKLLG